MPHSRRRPAQSLSADAEIEATRNSLNVALGNIGGHQKSWMWSDPAQNPNQHQTPTAPLPESLPPPPSVPKRKRGRPPLRSQTDPQIPPPHQTAAVLAGSVPDADHERHPASNSTSPQLANIVSRRISTSPQQSPPRVLPSPSPSEDVPMKATAAPTSFRALSTGSVGRDATTGNGIGQSPRDSPDVTLREAIQQAQNKRPRIENQPYHQVAQVHSQAGQNAASRPHAFRRPSEDLTREYSPVLQSHPQIHQPIQPRPSSRTQSRLPLLHGTGATPPQVQLNTRRSPSLGSVQHPHGVFSAHPPQQQHNAALQCRPSATPPQPLAPFGPPGSLSHSSAQHVHTTPPAQLPHGVSTQPQQASSEPSLPHILSPMECYDVIAKFRLQNASNILDIDTRRLDVLRDAVAKSDWDYITLHQFYCLLDVDPQSLPQAIVSHPQLKFAHSVLREVLDSNQSLSLEVRQFFANFPYPIAQLATNWPQTYDRQQRMFLRFVSCSANYPGLQQACAQRKYPPVMRELFNHIGVPSVVLQRIIFTAILRRLSAQWGGGPHSPIQHQFENEALALFLDNQNDFIHRKNNRPPNVSVTYEEQETILEIATFGEKLRDLCQRQARLLQSNSSVLPSQIWQAQQGQQQTHTRLQRQPSIATLPPQIMPRGTRQTGQILQPFSQHGPGQPRPSSSMSVHPFRQIATFHNVPQIAPPTPSLLPPRGWRQPEQRIPNPGRFALHQATLRDPLIRAQAPGSPLYQYVKAFAQPPKRLTDAGLRIEKWQLPISPEELRNIPKDTPGVLGQPPSRTVCESSLMFRLRGIKWPAEELPNEHTWAITETCFHPYAYFTFNGAVLQKRKKLHYGKDLPIDLTEFIKEGDNVLEIAVLRQSKDKSFLKYLLAIEVVGIENHNVIKQTCFERNHVSATEVIEGIRRKLAPASTDDDIAIIQSNLSITLFDPFSASRICDIPVRSKACLHNDCFDLETFLQTRQRKNDASVSDAWRCPICNADARPQFLIVDEFLQQVQKELAQRGLLDTRAITVNQDGSWKLKVEPGSGNRGQDTESPEDTGRLDNSALSNKSNTPPIPTEVIDLSD